MEVKTFRARSVQEALARVRQELGDEAAVLQTREVGRGWWNWLTGQAEVEVTAATEVVTASHSLAHESHGRIDSQELAPERLREQPVAAAESPRSTLGYVPYADNGRSLVEELCEASARQQAVVYQTVPDQLLQALLDAGMDEELAREFVERTRRGVKSIDQDDAMLLKARLLRMLEDEFQVSGPIRVTPGQRRVAALVGPTGVGKTTTIAKLAAHFRLREKRRVGLVTVDTYRIAAVEQLRTYADIMDLPLEVVATPREMRQALQRLADVDLVLLDTAGRGPRDEVRLQELKSLLTEAVADEVHLVLSCEASVTQLKLAVEQFTRVGVTSLLLTKADETRGLGHLVPVLRVGRLPLSYLTNGQNVPEDLEPAEGRTLARSLLAWPGDGW